MISPLILYQEQSEVTCVPRKMKHPDTATNVFVASIVPIKPNRLPDLKGTSEFEKYGI